MAIPTIHFSSNTIISIILFPPKMKSNLHNCIQLSHRYLLRALHCHCHLLLVL